MIEWYMTLSRIEARIFKRTSLKTPARLVKTVSNPLGREKNRALTKDKPGKDRVRVGKSVRSHSMGPESDPHEDAAVQFAHEVAKFLDSESKKGSFEGITVFSDPHMKGLLKAKISKKTENLIRDWKSKNISKLSDREIVKMLDKTPVTRMPVD
jgi:protein required for attachment to host cells